MTHSKVLNFENARALSGLYAGDSSLLESLEQKFDVKVTTRDGWMKVEGPQKGLDQTAELFSQLQQATKNGVKIRGHEFRYTLNAIAKGQSSDLDDLWKSRITLSGHKSSLVPKTFAQKAYLDAIRNHDLCFGVGPAGTGKTFLAVAMAVAALKHEDVHRIILTRPAVEAGEALGFLPGDLNEKIFPYLRPLYDALQDLLGAEEVSRYMEKGIIEIAPLAYMRGRTLANSFVILDEAQNTTTEQMFMFLTRLGPDSQCVVTGDPTQIDLPRHRKSGLVEAMQALCHIEGIAFYRFNEQDVIRHELVGKIVAAYKKHRGEKMEEG
ncbi:MAG: PhoH family protein [Verrucomicrobiales bacterium]|jgi:phosphate starvation-inducible PhoH-like protein|nr:PhoH family protein [Verrucomicrobiales bacterium]